jgi:hypothetical protein
MFLAGLFEPPEVHQAVGMMLAQLHEGPVGALARLRGHAALIDKPLVEVARAVIGQQLSFGP